MHSAKESLKDVGSSAKKDAKILEAKAEEQALKATARTSEEKKIIEQQRKAKEAEAKMELHEAKARHAQETLTAKTTHHLTGAAATAAHHLHPHVGATAAGGGYVDPSMTTSASQHGAAGHYPPANPVAGATDPMYPTGGHVRPTAGHGRRHL